MKLAILGSSGRMGTAIRQMATQANHEIVANIDVATVGSDANLGGDASRQDFGGAEVVFDFTQPSAVLQNIRAVAEAGLPMVVGTTGWYQDLNEAREIVEENRTGLVWGANFSLGALLLMRLTKHAAAFFDRFPEYDPYVLEHHHRGKQDAPSGTGKRLAQAMVASLARKHRVMEGNPGGQIPPDSLHLASVRAGEAFGTHTVGFDAAAETFELTHRARGREGFALGALYASELIQNRKGIYEFSELFEEGLNP